jgi:hypothetical protein
LLNPHNLHCIFCIQNVEDSAHLLFSCPFSKGVWDAVSNWIGKSIPYDAEVWNHFLLFDNMVKLKDGGRVGHLIWLAITGNL